MSIEEIASRHNVSVLTVISLAEGLRRTGGRQVQFNAPELGGFGQWMPGMVQVGRMFDDALKARVSALCAEVAVFVAEVQATTVPPPPFAPLSTPAVPPNETETMPRLAPLGEPLPKPTPGLGNPNASGSQNGARYAYYAAANRLLIEQNGRTAWYDTTGFRLQGVSQQQGGLLPGLAFTSDRGPVFVDTLPIVDPPQGY